MVRAELFYLFFYFLKCVYVCVCFFFFFVRVMYVVVPFFTHCYFFVDFFLSSCRCLSCSTASAGYVWRD